MNVAGLFAGVGGLELGLQRAGHHANLLCEVEPAARAVLQKNFAGAALAEDVRELVALPRNCELLTAGFPCQDLSQAGRTSGIHGAQSGLVEHVFRLLKRRRVPWVLLENVKNMLSLDGGAAMDHLVSRFEALGYSWAYRVVDTRAFGLPQRRQRVFFLASRNERPEDVLLADDTTVARLSEAFDLHAKAFGFYWTEGNRGVGWAREAIPTLKGGSTIGIPSPPAIWFPRRASQGAFATPGIADAEELQGFPREWTALPGGDARAERQRWKMVGNAVSVPVASWIGERLLQPGVYARGDARALEAGRVWPHAAFGRRRARYEAHVSQWPRQTPVTLLSSLVKAPRALSFRAAHGFYTRLTASSLRVAPREFHEALREYCAAAESGASRSVARELLA